MATTAIKQMRITLAFILKLKEILFAIFIFFLIKLVQMKLNHVFNFEARVFS